MTTLPQPPKPSLSTEVVCNGKGIAPVRERRAEEALARHSGLLGGGGSLCSVARLPALDCSVVPYLLGVRESRRHSVNPLDQAGLRPCAMTALVGVLVPVRAEGVGALRAEGVVTVRAEGVGVVRAEGGGRCMSRMEWLLDK